MYETKWTIRGIEDEAREAVESIHMHTGIPYGRLVSLALWEWIETLDMDDPIPVTRPFEEAA